MSKPNIIAERDKRDEVRKKAKREFDSIITLSIKDDDHRTIKLSATGNGKTVRLLDEGMVVDGNGDAWFYIEKGSLQTFYDNLSDDYVGTINLGHLPLATHPIILGQWTKKDLTIVDIGDDRKALDVDLKLNEELNIVQDLRKQPFELGVSAEFTGAIDWEATERTGLEFLKSVTITDFAIVGDAGNVNSGGIELKGGIMEKPTIKDRIAKLASVFGLSTDPADPKNPEADPKGAETDPKGADEIAEKLNAAADALEQRDEMLALIADLGEEKAELETKLKEAEDKATALEGDKKDLTAELSAKNEKTEAALERFTKLAAMVNDKKDLEHKENKELSVVDTTGGWGIV